MNTDHSTSERVVSARPSGIVLGGSAVVMAVFMAMHPRPHSHELLDLVTQLTNEAGFNGFVHGVLMATLAAAMAGLLGLGDALGFGAMLVRAGLLSFCCGGVMGMLAAAINGFVLPAVVSRRVGDAPEVIEKLRPLMSLCLEGNRVLSQMMVVGVSAGVLLLSVALVRRAHGRGLGILGIVCASLPLAALVAGRLPMSVHGFGAFVLLQVVWYLAVATQMIRGRI